MLDPSARPQPQPPQKQEQNNKTKTSCKKKCQVTKTMSWWWSFRLLPQCLCLRPSFRLSTSTLVPRIADFKKGGFKEPFRKPKPDSAPQRRLNTKFFCIFLSWTEHQLIREVFLELGSLAGMVCYFSFQACPSMGIHSHPNRKRDPCHAGPVLQRAFLGLKDRHCHGWIWIWTSSQWLSWSNNHTLQPSKSVLRLKHFGATVEGDCGQVHVMIYFDILYIVIIYQILWWSMVIVYHFDEPHCWTPFFHQIFGSVGGRSTHVGPLFSMGSLCWVGRAPGW